MGLCEGDEQRRSGGRQCAANFKRSPKNTSKGTLIRRHFVPRLLLLLVSDRTQGAAAYDSTPSPQSLPSVAGTGVRGYDAKPALKLGPKTAAVQNLSKPRPSASSDCPAQCLDRSIPWWYRKECQACHGMRRMVGNELTWTCPPTWPPQRLFIIFSMQRSATQTACFSVDSLPDTACLGELLNQGLYPRNTTDPERMLQDAFEATQSASGLAPCTWGFRLLYQDGMLYPQLLEWLWSILDASIILERSNGAIPHDPPYIAFPTDCACVVCARDSDGATRVIEACPSHGLLGQPKLLPPRRRERESAGRVGARDQSSRLVLSRAKARSRAPAHSIAVAVNRRLSADPTNAPELLPWLLSANGGICSNGPIEVHPAGHDRAIRRPRQSNAAEAQ